MATFKTHLSVATLASGMAATTITNIGLATLDQTPLLFALGVAGGLLPDIDADNSIPVRLAFSLLGLIGAFGVVLYVMARYRFSISELTLLVTGTFLAIRYVLFELFLRLTEHRGIFHSLLAAAFFLCLGTSLSYNLGGTPARLAWLHGLFVGMGYVVHLTLDELFSVDLLGGRLKRSFGTALKLFSRDLKATLTLGFLTLGLAVTLPDPDILERLLSRHTLIRPVQTRLWPPPGQWFAPWRPKARSHGDWRLD